MEDVEALGIKLAVVLHAEEEGAGAFEFGVVEGALRTFEVDDDFFLDPGGEIARDLRFSAAYQEMFDALGEARAGGGVGLVVVKAFERGLAAEEAGLGEGEEAPEVEETVFDGRAGEDEAVGGAEGASGGRGGAGGVLDVLAFVEDDGVPALGREGVGVEAELSVVGDQEVSAQGGERGAGGARGGFGVRGLRFGGDEGRSERGGGEARGEAGGLELPVDHDGFGADDEDAEGFRGGGAR